MKEAIGQTGIASSYIPLILRAEGKIGLKVCVATLAVSLWFRGLPAISSSGRGKIRLVVM